MNLIHLMDGYFVKVKHVVAASHMVSYFYGNFKLNILGENND